MGRIPDRWKEYSGCGKPIKDIPVFAFKTPLAKKYSVQHDPNQEFVEQEKEFTPENVIESVKELGCEVVVIIDLTNTFRYYNGIEEFGKKHDVQYEKVKCEGQKIPNDSVLDRVANIISDVIHIHGKDSKKLVGIHCTHGVNRTGYLLSRYMIEWLGYEPEKAIEAFNSTRGHDMEREAYLEDLKARTPEKRFDAWQKERNIVDSVNGTGNLMTLWTDFGDESNEFPNDDDDAAEEEEKADEENTDEKSKTNNIYHSYQQSYNRGGRHHNNYWRGYHRQRPYYNNRGKWSSEKSSVKESSKGLADCKVNFFEDNFIFGDEEFSTVTFENDQFLKKEATAAAAQMEEKTSA